METIGTTPITVGYVASGFCLKVSGGFYRLYRCFFGAYRDVPDIYRVFSDWFTFFRVARLLS